MVAKAIPRHEGAARSRSRTATDERGATNASAVAADVRSALGEALVCLVVHGSAAGSEWIPGRSDINTALVVPRIDVGVLERLAPIVRRWRGRSFALPVLMDEEYLAGARDTFP